jgi:hypothetical protein
MYNEHTFNIDQNVKHSILYAYTNTGEDLTHEFDKFKSTILKLKLCKQDIYNIIMGYKNQKTQMIEYIKYMTDDDFIEQVLKDNS